MGVSNASVKIGSLTRTLVLGGVVAAAALIPLFGDPTGTTVSHAEWARYLLRGLDLLDPTVRVGEQASIAFGILSGRDSLSFRGDRYVSARGVEAVTDGGARRVRSVAGIGQVSYALAVARPGEYRLRLRMSGDPGTPAEAEVSAGDEAPKQTFPVVPGPAPGWVDVGALKLTRGGYTASILLPQGAEIEQVEMAPPCVNAIEPRGGWRAVALTRTPDAALTALRAVDLESELPPADVPLDLLGSDFRVEPDSAAAIEVSSGNLDNSLRAGPSGTRAVLTAKLPEAGLYVLSYFGASGAGQSWGIDQCRRAVLCPDDAPAGWHTVLSSEFTAGLHSFDVLLGPGAVVHRVRLERKKDASADYLATTKRLGLDLGEDSPLTRDQAGEAWRWVAAHRTPKEQQCGEVVIPQTLVASNADSASGALPPPFVVNPLLPPVPPPPYPNPVPPLSPIDLVP